MKITPTLRAALVTTVAVCAVGGQLAMADGALAVTVTKGELNGGQLRVQGSDAAPGIFVIASCATGSAGVRANEQCRLSIQAGAFSSPDCRITVSGSDRTPIDTIT